MKKIMAVLMCVAMSAALFACNGQSNSKSSGTVSIAGSSTGGESKSGTGSSNVGSTASNSGSSNSSKTASGTDDSKSSTSPGTDISDMKMSGILKKICEGTEVPTNDIFDLDKSNFENYSFIPWTDGIEAACSEGQISTDAHSMVLIRVNNVDAKKTAEAIADKADARKWICVGAETGKVLYTDKYVLMVMTYSKVFEGIKSNFEKLMGTDEVNSVDIKSAGEME